MQLKQPKNMLNTQVQGKQDTMRSVQNDMWHVDMVEERQEFLCDKKDGRGTLQLILVGFTSSSCVYFMMDNLK